MFAENDETSLLPCRAFKAHKDYLTRLLLSPDVKSLATCSADHTVRIWKIDPAEENLEAVADEEKQKPDSPDLPPSGSGSSFSPLPLTHDPMQSSIASVVTNGTNGHPSHLPERTDSFQNISELIAKRKPLPCDVVLDNHQRWVWDCAFSADSAYLVTVSSDHYARLWELSTAQIIRQYNGHHRGAVCVALNDYSEPR